MTTEVIIEKIKINRARRYPPQTKRERLIISNERHTDLVFPSSVDIVDTSKKTIIDLNPPALTDKNNLIQTQGAIIDQKNGRITLPSPGCLLNMTLNFLDEGGSKNTNTYQIKRVNLPALD